MQSLGSHFSEHLCMHVHGCFAGCLQETGWTAENKAALSWLTCNCNITLFRSGHQHRDSAWERWDTLTHKYVCTSEHLYTYAQTYTHIHMCIHTSRYLYTFIHTYMLICIFLHTHTTPIYICIQLYSYRHLYIPIPIYIHTYFYIYLYITYINIYTPIHIYPCIQQES